MTEFVLFQIQLCIVSDNVPLDCLIADHVLCAVSV